MDFILSDFIGGPRWVDCMIVAVLAACFSGVVKGVGGSPDEIWLAFILSVVFFTALMTLTPLALAFVFLAAVYYKTARIVQQFLENKKRKSNVKNT